MNPEDNSSTVLVCGDPTSSFALLTSSLLQPDSSYTPSTGPSCRYVQHGSRLFYIYSLTSPFHIPIITNTTHKVFLCATSDRGSSVDYSSLHWWIEVMKQHLPNSQIYITLSLKDFNMTKVGDVSQFLLKLRLFALEYNVGLISFSKTFFNLQNSNINGVILELSMKSSFNFMELLIQPNADSLELICASLIPELSVDDRRKKIKTVQNELDQIIKSSKSSIKETIKSQDDWLRDLWNERGKGEDVASSFFMNLLNDGK
ncbi:hypothetical protein P9112_011574 [Eukaryota sp. TZLM1-RC]